MRPSRSTGSNGVFMPATPTVSMCPQNISDRPGDAAFERADDVGAAGRGFLGFDVQAHAAHRFGDRAADRGFASRARHQ